MPKFKVRANEMTEATVSHISLVDRGANRIPFKIVKQEKSGMAAKHFASLDLRNLFVRKKEEQVEKEEVEIVGVVTMDDDEEAKKLIEEAGFSTLVSKVMEDGSVVFAQVEDDETPKEELSVLKWTNDIALVMKGFSPYMMDVAVGDNSFADKCKAQGFYPGIRTVSETIVESINSIVAKSEDSSEAASQVATLCDEVRDYITSLVSSLPTKAFKIEKPMDDSESEDPMKKKKKKPVDDSGSSCKADFKPCEGCKTPKECAAKGVCANAEKDKTVTEDVAKACKPKKKVKESVDDTEKSAKGKPEDMEEPTDEDMEEPVVEETEVEEGTEEEMPPKGKKKKPVAKQDLTVEDISSIVTTKMDESISKLVGLIDKRLDAISARVEKAEAAVVETNGKLKGVLVPGSDSGDPSPTQKSEKGNGVFGGRDIDTAFQPGIRTRVR